MRVIDNKLNNNTSKNSLRLVVTSGISHRGFELLAPDPALHIGNCEILYNPPRGTECDFWIVFAASRNRDYMLVDPTNTLFIAGEPPSKKIYPPKYYSQFENVVSCNASDPHPNVSVSAPCLPWHIGLDKSTDTYRFGYQNLVKMPYPEGKLNKISVVCSDLRTTQGQRDRLFFLDYLKKALPGRIDHFGRGFNPIDDKMEAILPYEYHLVLENSLVDHYWTEKLSDSLLGWAYPIYSGCSNLDNYFPSAGFTQIDIYKPELAVAKIEELISKPIPVLAIQCARERILNEYNPFCRFSFWANHFYTKKDRVQRVCILNHRAFRSFPRSLLFKFKSLFTD